MNENSNLYDVIIMGSGVGGATMAAILAHHGHRVLLMEKGQHPRFAIGESTLPQASYWMWLISERYGLPELKNLAESRTVAEHIAPTSGIKRSIGFAYHHPGKEQDMLNESHQVLAPELPFISESHYYREDIDLYMVRVAEKYGATLMENTEVTAVDANEEQVTVTTKDGTTYHARFLIDSSGSKSIVADTYGLRDEPTRLETQSRAIFSHFESLKPFDDLFPKSSLPNFKYRWHDGTLHHIFDGGWFWIIPFDNHCDSVNTKASIGLMLDMRKFPMRDDVTPEKEFNEIVARFPTIAKHLENATAKRPYIRTGRLQYSCKKAIGPRFYITPQAYGAVDALYSRGLISTFESIYVFMDRLLTALKDDDFSEARFAGLDELARQQLDSHDQMVLNAYKSFGNFNAWSIWLKVWLSSKLYGDVWLLRTTMKYMSKHDRSDMEALDLSSPPFSKQLQEMVDLSTRVLTDAEAGRISWDEATAAIEKSLQATDWLPHRNIPLGAIEARNLDFTPERVMPLIILWGKTLAPKWVRNELFDFPTLPLIKMKLKEKIGMM